MGDTKRRKVGGKLTPALAIGSTLLAGGSPASRAQDADEAQEPAKKAQADSVEQRLSRVRAFLEQNRESSPFISYLKSCETPQTRLSEEEWHYLLTISEESRDGLLAALRRLDANVPSADPLRPSTTVMLVGDWENAFDKSDWDKTDVAIAFQTTGGSSLFGIPESRALGQLSPDLGTKLVYMLNPNVYELHASELENLFPGSSIAASLAAEAGEGEALEDAD